MSVFLSNKPRESFARTYISIRSFDCIYDKKENDEFSSLFLKAKKELITVTLSTPTLYSPLFSRASSILTCPYFLSIFLSAQKNEKLCKTIHKYLKNIEYGVKLCYRSEISNLLLYISIRICNVMQVKGKSEVGLI